jgi:hypothetical protein
LAGEIILQFGERIGREINGRDAGTASGKGQSQLSADTAGGSGDEDNLVAIML